MPERGRGLSQLENIDIICIITEDCVRGGSGQAVISIMPMTAEE